MPEIVINLLGKTKLGTIEPDIEGAGAMTKPFWIMRDEP